MSLRDYFTTAQIAQLDQERADIDYLLLQVVAAVSACLDENKVDRDEAWCSVLQEFSGLERVRSLALLTECVFRLADLKRAEKGN